ncbi:MAG: hypothetical protein ACTSQI_19705 [Candidatus Helarchaeota archaeon]
MVDLDELLKCAEHDAPYLIIKLDMRREKKTIFYTFTVICPVDQNLSKITTELSQDKLEKLYLPLADKIYRCEKCFREAQVEDVAIEKKKVSIFLSCVEHGRLIIREIHPRIYDKIKFIWDMKDVKKEEERTY